MNKKVVGICLIVLGIIGSFYGAHTWYSHVNQHDQLVSKITKQKKEYRTAQINYKLKKNKVQRMANIEAVKKSEPLAKAVGEQNIAYTKLKVATDNFFRVYYTWNDSQTYHERVNKLNGQITDNLADNKKVFDEGKDATGGDYIKNTELHSQYDSSEVLLENDGADTDLKAMVQVQYDSWMGDTDSETGTRYYDVNYDTNNNKISKVKLLMTKSN